MAGEEEQQQQAGPVWLYLCPVLSTHAHLKNPGASFSSSKLLKCSGLLPRKRSTRPAGKLNKTNSKMNKKQLGWGTGLA
jgi:hypothetical protein